MINGCVRLLIVSQVILEYKSDEEHSIKTDN